MKTIKLTERDLELIVKKVLNEQRALPSAGLGQKGNEVMKIQQELLNKGYTLGTSGPNRNGVDGKFGPVTQNAIKDFQTKMKLNPTGVIDQQTRNYLFSGSVSNILGVGVKSQQKADVKKSGTQTTQKKERSKAETSSAAKKVAKCETGTDQVLISGASLLFDGDKLYWLVNGKTIKSWNAVSGLTWKNTPTNQWGEMLKKYTTSRQKWSEDKDAGPLPEGSYSVGPLQTRGGNVEEISGLEAFWYKITGQVESNDDDRAFCKNTILSRISWGNYRAAITPTGNQDMYERKDFYIHGGSIRGSHGCIDLTDDMEDFAKFFGVWSSSNKKKVIPLTVKYKNPRLNQIIQKLVNLT